MFRLLEIMERLFYLAATSLSFQQYTYLKEQNSGYWGSASMCFGYHVHSEDFKSRMRGVTSPS